jgi:hypothetical protein
VHVSVLVQAFPSLQLVLFATAPQVPSLPPVAAPRHDWQSVVTPPPHAVSQHTPSTQNAD